MDYFIPNSDDECDDGDKIKAIRARLPSGHGEEEKIYSDEEDFQSAPSWHEPSMEITTAHVDNQTDVKLPPPRLGIPRQKMSTAARSRQPHRRLFTKAVVEKATPIIQDESTQPLSQHENADSIINPMPPPFLANKEHQSNKRSSSTLGSMHFKSTTAFLGKEKLFSSTNPSSFSCRSDEIAAAERKALDKPSADANNGSLFNSGSLNVSAPLLLQKRPNDNKTCTLAADVVLHRTDDGLNVVYKRQKTSQDNTSISKENKQQQSVNTGWGNNFVRINLKKGKGSTSFKASRHVSHRRRWRGGRRFKPQRLRQVGDGSEFMEGWEGSKGHCYRCGGTGHWAKDCTAQQGNDAGLVSSSDEETIDARPRKKSDIETQAGDHTMDSRGEQTQHVEEEDAGQADVEHLCHPDTLHQALKDQFGFSQFRGLQLQTIQKVIQGNSCLAIMPTGMGKSLCYQLPSLLLPGLTLVVSPLISLMHDQCSAAPPQLCPAVLWSGQTPADARRVLADVCCGKIKLLFISPERLSNPHLMAALQPRMPLSLVVIDEAHCVAEWGHSFRPAYFRLGEILHRDVQTRSLLALTATATKATETAVRSVLRLKADQVLRESAIRTNLRLSVMRSDGTPGSGVSSSANWNRIVNLFKSGGTLEHSKSAIVYCAWKHDADSLASAFVSGGIRSKSYHAGRKNDERSAIVAAFKKGSLRVVVATVAFGMGIDISSVDAVVHATMPRSLEDYVQQIGRAGRAGGEARCIAYISDADFVTLRSLAYSGTVIKETVSTLLHKIFEESDNSDGNCHDVEKRRHFGILPYKKLSVEMDMQEESFEAVLGYLEADEDPYVRVLPPTAVTVKVSFYATSAEEMAEAHPIVHAVLAVCPRHRNGLYSISTTKLARYSGKTPGAALQDLQVLAQEKLIGFELSSEKGFVYEVLRQPSCLGALVGRIHEKLSTTLSYQIYRLDTAYRAFALAAAGQSQEQQEFALREAMESYFLREEDEESMLALQHGMNNESLDLDDLPLSKPGGEDMLCKAKAALRRYREQGGKNLSALTLARILHGTGSAATPRDQWSKRMVQFWGSLRDVDFPAVLRASILACKSIAL